MLARGAFGHEERHGAGLPLELTFSCILPQGLEHCGGCTVFAPLAQRSKTSRSSGASTTAVAYLLMNKGR